jgi:predicted acyl esterase
MGGCLLSWDMLPWATTMLAYNARPPDPAVVGDSWRQRWIDRMDRTPPFIEHWLAHQRRDSFWKHGSVCEDYSAISCAVYMVGGWADAYRGAILRFLQNYRGPCKGLIGPWGHVYPQDGAPGPAIGFLQEAVRWWDHWLKGADNGIMDEPKLRLYMQEAMRPAPTLALRPGHWVAEPGWPPSEPSARKLVLRAAAGQESGTGRLTNGTGAVGGGPGSLAGAPGPDAELQIRGSESVAADPGPWCGWGGPIDYPADQRADDGQSLTFDTAPLAEPVEILGFPSARLVVASDRPTALVAVRLCDVWPDGASTLVTRGLLNLAHRVSSEEPSLLEPGHRYSVEVRLGAIAYAVPAGHRLRLAVSPTYWPWAWPSPEPVTLTVVTGPGSFLNLPLRTSPGTEDRPPPHFSEPEAAPPPPYAVLGADGEERSMERDARTGLVRIVAKLSHWPAARLLESGLCYDEQGRDIYQIVLGEPLSARTTSERSITVARGDWHTRVEARGMLSASAEAFLVTNTLEGYERDARVFARSWHRSVPRDGI